MKTFQVQQKNIIAMEAQSGEKSENIDSPKHRSGAARYLPSKFSARDSVQYSPIGKGRNRSPEHSEPASEVTSVGRTCLVGAGTWTWEIASSLVAVACFTGILMLLLSVKDKPVPNWPSGITVNAILSVLVTVMKGAMGAIIAECISQLKWSWFKYQRKLIDLETLDDASRGAWGAATLLLTRRSWFLAYWGAFVFLAGFFIGPTIQLTVGVELREIEIPSQAASVPVCNATHLDLSSSSASSLNTFPLDTIGYIYNGLLRTSKNETVTPSCPSGNCTFPTYQSFGLCNECADISDKMRFLPSTEDGVCPTTVNSSSLAEWRNSDRPCMVELPGFGLSLDRLGLINTTWGYERRDLDHSPNSGDGTFEPPAGVLRAILRNGKKESQPFTYSAVDCSLRLCVQTYEGAVRLGSFYEKTLSSTWTSSALRLKENGSYTFEVQADPCYIDGHRIMPPYTKEQHAKCMYLVDEANSGTLMKLLPGLRGDAREKDGKPEWGSNYIMTALWGLFSNTDWDRQESGSFQSVDRAMTSMANALTNVVRSSLDTCQGASVQGTSFSNELYHQVDWIWLAPTLAVLTLCLAFFVAVIINSRNEIIWKSSVFAPFVSPPRVGAEELTAEEILRRAKAQAVLTRQPVPGLVQRACEQIEVTCAAATVRFRAHSGDTELSRKEFA